MYVYDGERMVMVGGEFGPETNVRMLLEIC